MNVSVFYMLKHNVNVLNIRNLLLIYIFDESKTHYYVVSEKCYLSMSYGNCKCCFTRLFFESPPRILLKLYMLYVCILSMICYVGNVGFRYCC